VLPVNVTSGITVIEYASLGVGVSIDTVFEDVGVFGALYDTIRIAEFVQLARV
jgi:hypothetical protein